MCVCVCVCVCVCTCACVSVRPQMVVANTKILLFHQCFRYCHPRFHTTSVGWNLGLTRKPLTPGLAHHHEYTIIIHSHSIEICNLLYIEIIKAFRACPRHNCFSNCQARNFPLYLISCILAIVHDMKITSKIQFSLTRTLLKYAIYSILKFMQFTLY